LVDGLFLVESQEQEATEYLPDTFAESSIETWAAEHLAIDQDILTPPDSLEDDVSVGHPSSSQAVAGQVCFGMVWQHHSS
jgi:hypothetical protein